MSLKTIKSTSKKSGNAAPPSLPPGAKLLHTLRGHTDWIGRIAWSPNGQTLASPSEDNTIGIWDAPTGKLLYTLTGHDHGIPSAAFDPSSRMLACGSSDSTVKLWEVVSGRLLYTLEGHTGSVNTVAFSSSILATGGNDGSILLWDPLSGKLLRSLENYSEIISSIAFDPTGRFLACMSGDNPIKLWDLGSSKIIRVIEQWQWGTSIAFDPTGKIIASTGANTVNLWDLATGKLLQTLEGHTGHTTCVAYLNDSMLLASKGLNEVRLWRTDTGACIATIQEPSSPFWPPGIAFHPRHPLLATVGSDHGGPVDRRDRLIHIWELDLDLLLAQTGEPTVTYTSAKIVLVGESSVGKSCLAMRIAENRYPQDEEQGSTHGMRFWPMAPERLGLEAAAPEGQRRDVVLWDMGGQDEYRLVHQLFLHDTTLALVLLDPTRGRTAFEEAEAWNKRLEKQLHGRPTVKLLVGAKLDKPSKTIDLSGLNRLRAECGFKGYYETSALNGRGISKLRRAIAEAIDWENLAATSRPELFQRIRDEIEDRRKSGEVVLHVIDLQRALSHEPPTEEEVRAVDAVTGQLATQGVIARSKVSTGEPVLVLQIQEIERYAGSLILSARNNPRGVPALELRAIAQPDFPLPGIAERERLPRNQERPVLECTVQLLLEHGICFQHEGLLIFPTLFAPAPEVSDSTLPHAVSLYYDFAGAIDNIYASLVAWLVLAQNFGRVRLWADRAEFEVKDGGLCGLRKVGRPGGFAHVDVYFETATPLERKELFISFVEEHLRLHGVEIRENVTITCPCGYRFEEETLRKRIARGDKDVGCPVCETRHDLTEGAAESRQRNPKLAQRTWALKTEIEKRRQKSTEKAVQTIERAAKVKPITRPIRLLHLSDLHFTPTTPVAARLQWLLEDLKQDGGLGFKQLDYLVISGDFTDRGSTAGFEKAYEFISGLTREFGLSAERCIFVPGNHDVVDLREAYDWREKSDGLQSGEWVEKDDIVLARNPEKYPLRFKPFSDGLFHKFLQKPFPTDYASQGMAIPFWETGLQFLTLNSCWQIDQFNRKRADMHVEAVASLLKEAQKQEEDGRQSGQLAPGKPLLRIAVWHHAVAGPEQMKDTDFLGHLQNSGVRIALHGDVHEMRRDLIGYWHEKKIHIVGSGSFGARAEDRPESSPRLYNVLEISRDLKSARVYTRSQPKPDGPWKGWNEWPRPDGGEGAVAYYDIEW